MGLVADDQGRVGYVTAIHALQTKNNLSTTRWGEYDLPGAKRMRLTQDYDDGMTLFYRSEAEDSNEYEDSSQSDEEKFNPAWQSSFQYGGGMTSASPSTGGQ